MAIGASHRPRSRHIQSILNSKKEVKQRRTSSRSRSSSSPSSYLPMRARMSMCAHASCGRRARADCLTECGRDYQRAQHGANTNKTKPKHKWAHGPNAEEIIKGRQGAGAVPAHTLDSRLPREAGMFRVRDTHGTCERVIKLRGCRLLTRCQTP